jgi:hypothetical protein
MRGPGPMSAGPATAAGPFAQGFLCSYPKSGRTWIRFAVAHLLNAVHDLQLEIDLRSLFALLPNMDGHEADPGKDVSAYAYPERPAVPLLLSSHLAFEAPLFSGRPIVFLVRCPLDVVVSNYFQKTRQDFTWDGDLPTFVRDPDVGTSDLVRYLNRWADQVARPEVMVLSYESLRADPEGGFIRLATHLGVPCGPAEARAALARASFPNMLAAELRSGVRGYDYDRGDPDARRVRRGRIGGYRDYLDADDVRHVADLCAQQLSPTARAVLEREGIAPWNQVS